MTSNSNGVEHEGKPPVPAVPPLLPETKLDVSFSLDQIIGDMKFEDTDIDPRCVSHNCYVLLSFLSHIMCLNINIQNESCCTRGVCVAFSMILQEERADGETTVERDEAGAGEREAER